MKDTMRRILTQLALLLTPSVTFAQSQTFQNPLSNTGIDSVAGLIASFLKAIVVVALPILTLFIVYSGFMFVLARGNESKLKTAKENFLYVILGSILILGAWVIATMIGATVTQVVGN